MFLLLKLIFRSTKLFENIFYHLIQNVMFNTYPALDTPKSPNKVVRFDEVTKCLFIPTRQELKQDGLANELWLQHHEYKAYQKEATTEVTHFILEKKNAGVVITGSQAVNMLFQPIQANVLQDLEPDAQASYTPLNTLSH